MFAVQRGSIAVVRSALRRRGALSVAISLSASPPREPAPSPTRRTPKWSPASRPATTTRAAMWAPAMHSARTFTRRVCGSVPSAPVRRRQLCGDELRRPGQFRRGADRVSTEERKAAMEYSVRTARIAVSTLLKLKTTLPPVYQGQHDIDALRGAPETLI